jgi:hypothetical protein
LTSIGITLLQAVQFCDTFELGVPADFEQSGAQEGYVLPQQPLVPASGLNVHVLLVPRQIVALLVLAKHAHLLNIKHAVARNVAIKAKLQSTLSRIFGRRRPAPDAPRRSAAGTAMLLDLQKLQAPVPSNPELGSSQAIRLLVAQCARHWRTRVAAKHLASQAATRAAGAWKGRALKPMLQHAAQPAQPRSAQGLAGDSMLGPIGLASDGASDGAAAKVMADAEAPTSARGITGRRIICVDDLAGDNSPDAGDAHHGAVSLAGMREIGLDGWDDCDRRAADVELTGRNLLQVSAMRRHGAARAGEAVTEGVQDDEDKAEGDVGDPGMIATDCRVTPEAGDGMISLPSVRCRSAAGVAAAAATQPFAQLRLQIQSLLQEQRSELGASDTNRSDSTDAPDAQPMSASVLDAAEQHTKAGACAGSSAEAPALPAMPQEPAALQWKRVRHQVGFSTAEQLDLSIANAQAQPSDDQMSTVVGQALPRRSASQLGSSGHRFAGMSASLRRGGSFASKGAMHLLGRLQEVVASAQMDPTVHAQQFFLSLLAQARNKQ